MVYFLVIGIVLRFETMLEPIFVDLLVKLDLQVYIFNLNLMIKERLYYDHNECYIL